MSDRENAAFDDGYKRGVAFAMREFDAKHQALESCLDEIGARLDTLQSRLDRIETADSKPTPKPEGGKEGEEPPSIHAEEIYQRGFMAGRKHERELRNIAVIPEGGKEGGGE